MPGITGIITKQISGNEKEKVDAMLNCMLHEPFYTHGTFQSPENGFFIGFCALDKSFANCMPIFNEKKDIVLFLTGETYHVRSDIITLAQRGHNFDPQNASCLVHMYEEEGENIFKTLNGWFNGILLDFRNSKIILFNDRCGIRRIYLYESNDFLAFSSEAKSLLKAFPELREVSFQSVAEVLIRDCVVENRTYFPKINLLPPCSAWTFHNGHIKKKVYYDISELENQPTLPMEQFVEKLEATFIQILPRYFSNGLVGLSVTGGLDTRVILACLNPEPGQLPCYTFGGTRRDTFDVRFAQKVAMVCNQPYTTLRLDDQKLLKEYPYQVERTTYISDGLESTDKTDALYYNKMSREIAPVRMTGKYGSQVLKGIVGFGASPPYIQLIHEDFRQYLDMANKTTAELREKAHTLTFVLQSAIPWWWNAFITLESSQVEVRSPFLDNDFLKVIYQAPPLGAGFGNQFELGLIAKTNQKLMTIPTTGFYGGNYPWPIPNIVKTTINLLKKLDTAYIAERLPYDMTHFMGKMDYFMSPLHLDRLLMGFIYFRRHRTWFRDELSGYLQDILLDNKTLNRPYWNKTNLIKMVNDHSHGKGTYLREIRKVLQMELVHRVLLEKN